VLSVKRILRDYEDAGSVNSLISLWGFVDDAAFLTKAGHVGIAYRLRGIDYEGLTHGCTWRMWVTRSSSVRPAAERAF
jgi:hypothetical protein